MCALSVADGFVEINENVGDMIKYVANEPSVGLFYIQQHAHNAVPNVVRLRNNLTEKSNEMNFHTEDLNDSTAMTRSMKDCGFPIINNMIRDIKTSLTLISSKQPVRGVISQRSSSSWAPVVPWSQGSSGTWDDSEKPESYFSSVLKSAKEKAVNLKWAPLDPGELRETTEALRTDEDEELPLSSQIENEITEESSVSTDGKIKMQQSVSVSVSVESEFEEFKAEREAFLEEWLTSSSTIL